MRVSASLHLLEPGLVRPHIAWWRTPLSRSGEVTCPAEYVMDARTGLLHAKRIRSDAHGLADGD
jgi:hypothetical protein